MDLSIDIYRTPTTIRLDVAGEIDMSTAAHLAKAITAALRAGAECVIVNLDAATFCDCAGITVLLAGRREATERRINYQVLNANGNPRRVLLALGLHTMLATSTNP